MHKSRVLFCAVAALAAAACGKGGGGGGGGGPAEKPGPVAPKTPSAKCGDAANTLAGLMGETPAPEDIEAIKKECETSLLSDAEAQCIADATRPLDVLRCPRALTPELTAVDKIIGTGPCRPVMLAMFLVENQQLSRVPEDQQERAAAIFGVVMKQLGKSCRTDAWGAEAMQCFSETDPMHAMECSEKVPKPIQEKINARITAELQGGGEDLAENDGSFVATGVEACDHYLGVRSRLEKCDAVPEAMKKTLLGVVAPLEKPWRNLPEGAVAQAADSLGPVCEQASAQLEPMVESVGCL
jgi:hypothetical protein